MPEPKKRGPKPKPDAKSRTGNNITFRARAGLRERLQAVADQTERSLSEEIETRLNASFITADLLVEIRAIVREEINAQGS